MLISLYSLYVSYFTTLYVVSNVEWFLNFGWDRIWKRSVVAYSGSFSGVCIGELRKNNKELVIVAITPADIQTVRSLSVSQEG